MEWFVAPRGDRWVVEREQEDPCWAVICECVLESDAGRVADALNCEAANNPSFELALARKEIDHLRAQLAHLTESAGDESCAGYIQRAEVYCAALKNIASRENFREAAFESRCGYCSAVTEPGRPVDEHRIWCPVAVARKALAEAEKSP